MQRAHNGIAEQEQLEWHNHRQHRRQQNQKNIHHINPFRSQNAHKTNLYTGKISQYTANYKTGFMQNFCEMNYLPILCNYFKSNQATSLHNMAQLKDPGSKQDRNISLDSLRGIFAIMVVYTHLELIRFYFGLPNNFMQPVINQLGRIGVTGFFVLSGFLITVNLLKTKQTDAPVKKKIGNFYLKRILRIWPLYYAVILLAIFVFPHVPFLHFIVPPHLGDARVMPETHIYYYTLLPQVPLAMGIVLPFAEPSWSIGVEEIFYLFIPLLLLFKKTNKYSLLFIAAAIIIARYMMAYAFENELQQFNTTSFIFFILGLCRFDCILIGCFAAYLFFEQHKWVEKLNKYHFIAAWILLFVVISQVGIYTYQYYHFALFFAIIILYAAKSSGTFLNNRVLAFVGKISFSLYMVHEVAIVALHNNEFFAEQADTSPFLWLYIITPLAAIALGYVAYNLIERPFLILKSRVK
jgi:peptidoglycan/LPS O-acetylase OafA/YrhL